MYLLKAKSHGRYYLFLAESVHVPGKGSTKKILERYGRWEDAPEEIKQAYEDQRKKKKLSAEFEEQYRKKVFAQVTQSLDKPACKPKEMGVWQEMPPLYYGHVPLLKIWSNDLDLRVCLYHLQRKHYRIDNWSFNDLLFYLCCRKILSPSSYLSAYSEKGNYFYCPWQGIVQDNFYRGLDFMYEHRETIIAHAVRSYLDKTQTKVKIAFFDCTNTYFETPYDDVGWQIIHFSRRKRDELGKVGLSEEQIDDYFKSETFCKELSIELALNEDEVIRMCGPSKDGKFHQPLVLVALAIDQNGLPIDCKVFAGNVAEVNTIDAMLDSLKRKYRLEDIYFVADSGLNSTKTLDSLNERGLGYVVAQKASYQKKEYRQDMLDLTGYRNCHYENDELVPSDGPLNPHEFRFKVSTMQKTAMVDDESGELTPKGKPKRKKITVNCQVIYTFDKDRRRKDLFDLQKLAAKANQAVIEKALMGNPCTTGWRALVKTQKEAAEGDDKEQYRAVGIKKNVIAEREAIAGYAAYVFDHPENTTEPMTDLQALSAYHRLVGIEDCFRVMKTNFSLRPVYVKLKEHIIAHCYLCFISLLMMRILQNKLEEAGEHWSSERICKTLGNAALIPLPLKDFKGQAMINVNLASGFFKSGYTGKGRIVQNEDQTEDFDRVFEEISKDANGGRLNEMNVLLSKLNLTPLPMMTTAAEAKNCLGISRASNEDLMCTITKKILEQAMI